jgi:[amino group carrier protein]-L-2-aminoadipate 6-kinase
MLVIKIGGAAGVSHAGLCRDIRQIRNTGRRMVIVHGGSAETDALAERLDHPPRFVTTPSGHVSRYTDRQTLEIFAMATARINRTLVERLQALGVNALGLSGIDGRLMTARRKDAIRSVENGRVRVIRDDWTGSVTAVNAALLQSLIDADYVPVIAPLAISDAGEMLNIDGDRAAAAIAGALRADTLLLLSNVGGLMRCFPDESSLVTHMSQDELEPAMAWAQGRMKKKILAAREALAAGVTTMIIGDGRRESPVHDALNGSGTHIHALEGTAGQP